MTEAIQQWMDDFGIEVDGDGRVFRQIRSSDDPYPPTFLELYHIEEFEKRVRAKELEQCCRDVCPLCNRGNPRTRMNEIWVHVGHHGCSAHLIRERAYLEEHGGSDAGAEPRRE